MAHSGRNKKESARQTGKQPGKTGEFKAMKTSPIMPSSSEELIDSGPAPARVEEPVSSDEKRILESSDTLASPPPKTGRSGRMDVVMPIVSEALSGSSSGENPAAPPSSEEVIASGPPSSEETVASARPPSSSEELFSAARPPSSEELVSAKPPSSEELAPAPVKVEALPPSSDEQPAAPPQRAVTGKAKAVTGRAAPVSGKAPAASGKAAAVAPSGKAAAIAPSGKAPAVAADSGKAAAVAAPKSPSGKVAARTASGRLKQEPKPAAPRRVSTGNEIWVICRECHEEWTIEPARAKTQETIACPICEHRAQAPTDDVLHQIALYKGIETNALRLALASFGAGVIAMLLWTVLTANPNRANEFAVFTLPLIIAGLSLVATVAFLSKYEKSRWETYF